MDRQSLFIVSILVIVMVVGFVFVSKRNENINSPQAPKEIISQPSVSVDQNSLPGISATQVTKDFYNAYIDCLKNPPAGSEGKISLYCQQNNDFASVELSKNLETKGDSQIGIDPVVCAKNPTPAISVDTEDKPQENTIKTHVSELFGIGNVVLIDVELNREQNEWKVVNISCVKS